MVLVALGTSDPRFLPVNHYEALLTASEILIDQCFEDLRNLHDGSSIKDTWMIDYLPRKYFHRYSSLVIQRFLLSISTVSWKLVQDEFYMLSSVAEELALNAIIDFSSTLLEINGIEANFDDFIDHAYEDTDFLVLFEEAFDGVEDTWVGERMGMSHVKFDEWFIPFNEASRGHVQPYLNDRGTPEWMNRPGDDS